MRYPLLHARDRSVGRGEARAERLFWVQVEVCENVLTLAVGYQYLYALIGHLAGDACLGEHAPTPEVRLAGLYVGGQIVCRTYLPYHLSLRVRRVSVIDAIYVAQYDERLCIHHGGYQAAQLIVIRKHQLRHRDGIVLIDYGNHTIGQHHVHAALLIEV